MSHSCYCAKVKKLLEMPWSAAFILFACAAALAAALTAQFAFDIQPCILCLWQRVPYATALVLSLLALFMCRHARFDCLILALCALAFFAGDFIAIFHSGVERHWWAGTEGCTLQPLSQAAGAIDVASLRDQLLHTSVARCDVIDFTFLGLSMANWNIFAFLFMGLFAAFASKGCHENRNDPKAQACCCCCRRLKK